ncbi:MAG: KamA family radical SAM protein [Bdellovibrionales bacterium]|nr:KamA family radical SAM protein [Bdellovibrionales bacterium]
MANPVGSGFNPEKLYTVGRNEFRTGGRGRAWKDVPDAQWNSWIWQQQNRVRTLEKLKEVINVTPDEEKAYEKSSELFNMAITPYYAAMMDPDDPNCPIRLQSVPNMGELEITEGEMEDPLAEERDMPVPGITHRYPDRVLFYTTHHCPVYCRHCTRKRKVADPGSAAQKEQLEKGIEYIRKTPSIRDVVISGGDPLSNSDDRLDYIMGSLRKIPHVEIFRLGTRNLVTLPHRITDDFVSIIKKHRPFFVHTHFNHPKECTAEAYHACMKIAEAGIPINNQMVLMKGINEDPQVVKRLNHLLLMMTVRPYYIFQCDMSQGIAHFRTSVDVGINIIEHLRGHTSGMAVPHFVVDAPGGGGKIPMLPNYVVSKDAHKVVLRNYAFKQFEYPEPEEAKKL